MQKVQPIEEVRSALTKMEGQFSLVLPPQLPAERFVRVAMTAIQLNPELITADRASLYGACMKAAQDGLLPDGREAALVPFKGRVQYMPMVAGILKKVRNSGELISISPHVVYERDQFQYWIDDNGEHIKHIPCLDGDHGPARLAYAVAKTRDGGVYIEVMTYAQIEQVRAISKAKDTGPWVMWWPEMAKKTVIRRLSKRLPMSTDLEQIFEHDNENYELDKSAPEETPASRPAEGRPSRVEEIVSAAMKTNKEDVPIIDEDDDDEEETPI